MDIDFIKERTGAQYLSVAKRQQEQLAYFTQSSVQEDISEKYLEEYAKRNYATNDKFLTWIKTLFRQDNFLSFYKYYRYPVTSSKLVNNKIKPQLQRVFHSEDSYFNYTIEGKEEQTPEFLKEKQFNNIIFDALLFRHNDIIIQDMSDINEPYREIISIKNVVAIKSHNSTIEKLAYSACIEIEGKEIHGIAYMDAEKWAFYDKDLEGEPLSVVEHDLGKCPADWISDTAFSSDNDIVRNSIFSHVSTDFEEYVFMKTLQKLTDPNGAFPVITTLQTKKKDSTSKGAKGSSDKEPMTSRSVTGQQSDEFHRTVSGSDSTVQAGTVIEVPPIKKDDGSIDMESVKSFINFFHHPVESLKYIDDRIKDIELNILSSVLGDLADQTDERKNELQVRGGFVSAEDRLRDISTELSKIRTHSDYKMLALKYGKDAVSVQVFYGSDFYLESQKDLYDLFELSPNPIERKNILIKLSKNRNKFNKENSEREVLLYNLMPYVSDKDFDKAVEQMAVDSDTFQLQTRFTYWITQFEANYGDIVQFYNMLENDSAATRLILINNLIKDLIKKAIVPVITTETNKGL